LERAPRLEITMNDLITSISNPSFRTKIMVDTEGDLKKSAKTSDYFSTPFPHLSADYSMGLLPYPQGLSRPVAVLEIRAYSRILGDFELKLMAEFIEAEADYVMDVKKRIDK